jgi:hypothetical protein
MHDSDKHEVAKDFLLSFFSDFECYIESVPSGTLIKVFELNIIFLVYKNALIKINNDSVWYNMYGITNDNFIVYLRASNNNIYLKLKRHYTLNDLLKN